MTGAFRACGGDARCVPPAPGSEYPYSIDVPASAGHRIGQIKALRQALLDLTRPCIDEDLLLTGFVRIDPAWPDALLMPYSLVVLPDQDPVLVTNSAMHDTGSRWSAYE
jgi:hypothetical protein